MDPSQHASFFAEHGYLVLSDLLAKVPLPPATKRSIACIRSPFSSLKKTN